MTIEEAINSWNNPKIVFPSSYISWRGYHRGWKPNFNSTVLEDKIQVDITSDKFHVDEITIDDLKNENDRTAFIEMVSEEIGTMKTLVGNLTMEVNSKILKEIMKDYAN